VSGILAARSGAIWVAVAGAIKLWRPGDVRAASFRLGGVSTGRKPKPTPPAKRQLRGGALDVPPEILPTVGTMAEDPVGNLWFVEDDHMGGGGLSVIKARR